MSGNVATTESGGGILNLGGAMTLTNSTVSGNTAPSAGAMRSDGGEYQGLTYFARRALFSSIDKVPTEECVDAWDRQLTTDQRGVSSESMCDVGAFEVQ